MTQEFRLSRMVTLVMVTDMCGQAHCKFVHEPQNTVEADASTKRREGSRHALLFLFLSSFFKIVFCLL